MACRRKINTFALLLFVIWQPSSKCRLPVFCSTARDMRRRKFYEITRVFAQALRRKNLREFSGTFQILEFSKREVGYFLTRAVQRIPQIPLNFLSPINDVTRILNRLFLIFLLTSRNWT